MELSTKDHIKYFIPSIYDEIYTSSMNKILIMLSSNDLFTCPQHEFFSKIDSLQDLSNYICVSDKMALYTYIISKLLTNDNIERVLIIVLSMGFDKGHLLRSLSITNIDENVYKQDFESYCKEKTKQYLTSQKEFIDSKIKELNIIELEDSQNSNDKSHVTFDKTPQTKKTTSRITSPRITSPRKKRSTDSILK